MKYCIILICLFWGGESSGQSFLFDIDGIIDSSRNYFGDSAIVKHLYDENIRFAWEHNTRSYGYDINSFKHSSFIHDYSQFYDLSINTWDALNYFLYKVDQLKASYDSDTLEKILRKKVSDLVPLTLVKSKKSEEFAFSIMYLVNHFKSDIPEVKDHLQNFEMTYLSTIKKGEGHLAIRDLALAEISLKDDLSQSRFLLNEAYKYYDSINEKRKIADINYQIARLYLERPETKYASLALDHIEPAFFYYLSLHDSAKVVRAGLKFLEGLNRLDKGRISFDEGSPVKNNSFYYYPSKEVQERKKKIEKINTYKIHKKILLTTEIVKSHLQGCKSSLYCSLYCELGKYFNSMKTDGDSVVATMFYSTAISKSISHVDDFLKTISTIEISRFIPLTRELNDAIEVALAKNDFFMLAKFYSIKANYFFSLNQMKQAIDFWHKSIYYGEQAGEKSKKNLLLQEAYKQISIAWANLGNVDSSLLFANKYSSVSRQVTVEDNNLQELEQKFFEIKTNNILKRKNDTIHEKDIEIRRRGAILDSLNLDITNELARLDKILKNKDIEIQKGESTLNKQRILLTYFGDSLNQQEQNLKVLDEKNRVASNNLEQKEKIILTKNNWIILILSIGAAIFLILIVIIMVYRSIAKARELKIIYERAKLNTLAKGKFHNVKNKYGKFLALIDSKNDSAAVEYAERSSKYISYALDNINYEANNWTLANEIELFNRFAYPEELLIPNLTIVKDFPKDLSFAKTRFIPDIFTTIFENSVLYGFDKIKNSSQCVFIIKFRLEDNLLCFEISDNGQPAKRLKSYQISGNPNKGINLVKRRIEAEILLNNKTKNLHPEFYAGPNNNNNGSIVKFSFPYEIST